MRRGALLGLGEDLLHVVAGDRKADPDIACPGFALAWAEQRRVDADDVPVEVDQRSARIAGVDRCVGLEEAPKSPRPSGLSVALMIPLVTVWPRLNGFPMATT